MKRAIVTGANGFIGSMLVKKLFDAGWEVVAMDKAFQSDRLPDNSNLHKVVSSLDDEESLCSSLPNEEYDVFYHLAWQGVNGADKADPLVQWNNVKVALNCAKAAKKLGCHKFLAAGTVAERAVESLPYLQTVSGGMMYGVAKNCAHLMLETFCKNIGLDFVWMQFSNIYGPTNKTGNLVSYTIEELLNNREATFGPALQPYDFIFVDDLLEAVYRLGVHKTKENSYFIGSGTPRILKEYLLEIGKHCGKEQLIKIGMRPDDGIIYCMEMFDTSSLVRDIGKYVSCDFGEGIRKTLEGYGL